MRLRSLGFVCLALVLSADAAQAQLKATTYVTGLNLPIAFIQDTADPANQYVVQQGGRIRLVRNGAVQATDFLNLSLEISSGGERGLLGMALAPDWATSGRFFINYTDSAGNTVVERFKRSASNPLIAETVGRKKLVWSTGQAFITQPFSNHNGGNLAFGPDGNLYIGMGDGGSGNDPNNAGQDPNELLGKMLRIDVNVADNHATGFTIPPGNPFAASSRPEIWSFGLRNPWRWSFDDPSRGGTGALIIADVGQSAREEINYQPAGAGGRNYGWRIREGLIATPNVPATNPAYLPLTDPIFDYGRSSGGSVTGGFVYRGSAIPAYAGRYFFGDFVSGRIWSLRLTINSTTGEATASDLQDHTTQLGSAGVSTFGVDANGELYFANYGSGRIYRIDNAGPVMTLDRTAMGFGAQTSGQAFARQTPAQTLRLVQSGAGTVTWSVTAGAPWLSVSQTSGTGGSTLSVSVRFAAGLQATQTANLTFTLNGASATTITLPITMNVVTGSSQAPTGSFDSPAEGSANLAGSIAVTGWALDDIQVTGVRIFRDAVAGEPPGSLVFIGNASIVEGARPDVLAAFPSAPLASKAGWGYLLLTNFLPGFGNGTFRLTAVADDGDGHATVLGTKTINCNNSASTAPFGAIDTPTQGGTVSGLVTNFGWVLAPGSRHADPPRGGMVQVVIDGAIASFVPSEWTSRGDLSALFPAAQFSGIDRALGVAVFDSTTLSNGVHTISWLVTDNLGSPAGIGSRYFTVANGSSVLGAGCSVLSAGCSVLSAQCAVLGAECADPSTQHAALSTEHQALSTQHQALSTQHQALSTQHQAPSTQHSAPSTYWGRRGFDPWAAYETFEPDASGVIAIQITELDRLELWVGEGASGHALVGGAKQALPIGSRLDRETGQFTWNPGVGFVGTYDFVFGDRRVRVTIGEKR